MQVLEGKADLYIFNSKGKVIGKHLLGNTKSKRIHYYRINKKIIHTLIIKSKFFIFKETTNMMFNKRKMIFPKWSPEKLDSNFYKKLNRTF